MPSIESIQDAIEDAFLGKKPSKAVLDEAASAATRLMRG